MHSSLTSPAIAAFPVLWAGRLPHQPFRGLHSVRFRCSLRARQVTYVTLYTEGFGRFVSSTTAPIATGRNESCRVGLPPTGESRLSTAHHNPGTLNLSWSRFWHRPGGLGRKPSSSFYCWNYPMSTKLTSTNPYLRDRDVRERTVIRSVETSSAIEGIRTIFKRRARA